VKDHYLGHRNPSQVDESSTAFPAPSGSGI
jgi:hypothetical protein